MPRGSGPRLRYDRGTSADNPLPGKFYNRKGEYIGPRPFGPLLLRHTAAARLLGIRPKDLTKLNVHRELYQGTYVYDPCEIYPLAGLPYPPKGTTNHNDME